MPASVRRRIILHNRQLRKQRKHYIQQGRNRAITLMTTQGTAPAANLPHEGLGKGHVIYTVGPMTFCRICGAIKTVSKGKRLTEPCRGWAPP